MLCTLKNFPWLFLVLAPWWPSNGFRLHHHESDAGSRWAHLLRFTEPPALELQTKVRENFTITEKTPTRAFSFSWLKLPASAFTFKTLYLACYTDLVGIIKQEKTLVGAFFMMVKSPWNFVRSSTAQSNAKRNSDQANIFPATISLHLQFCMPPHSKTVHRSCVTRLVCRARVNWLQWTYTGQMTSRGGEMTMYLQLCGRRQSRDTLSVCGVLQSEALASLSSGERAGWCMEWWL